MKVKKNKKTGELIVFYDGGLASGENRLRILSAIAWRGGDVTVIVDTNQRIGAKSADEIEKYLNEAGIRYKSVAVCANKSKLFGMIETSPRGKKANERLIIIDLEKGRFGEELFGLIKNYDIAFGLGRAMPFEQTCDAIIQDISGVLFNKTYFEESVYDSVVCSSLRCSSGIKGIEGILDEMGL